MEPVKGELIDHIEKNKNACGQPDGQSEYINGCKAPVPPQIPQRDYDVVSDHVMLVLKITY